MPSPGLPVKDVLVRNCTISSKSCAIKWEQIDFGHCDHGNLQDMTVTNVTIFNSSRGIGFQQRNGHGDIKNITISDVEISTLFPIGTNWWGSAEPIWITNVPTVPAEGEPGKLGTIMDVSFRDVRILSENGMLLSGIGRPIGPISMDGVSLTLAVRGNASCAKGQPGKAPTGCADYRPVNCPDNDPAPCPWKGVDQSGVVPSDTAGLRVEGSGTARLRDVSIAFAAASPRPPYWAKGCVENASLPKAVDPHAQGFRLEGQPRCTGAG